MHIKLAQQPPPDRLSGTALEQHVVWHDYGGPTGYPEHRSDVLDEVELLVGSGLPEVRAGVGDVLPFLAAVLADDGNGRFLAERWIGQHYAWIPARWLGERVPNLDERRPVRLPDPVYEHVHRCQPGGAVHQFGPGNRLPGEPVTLVGGQLSTITMLDVFVRGKQETASAARRVCDRVGRPWLNAVDHRCDERTWSEVLACSSLDVLGTLRKKFLVGVALDVYTLSGPLFLVDQVRNQLLEFRGILDLVLRLAEDHPQRADLLAEIL